MTLHARPHLQTHHRSAGHSAVAGAAYRLGLRLYDRRADVWRDYTHRKRGDEIVLARTVAPADAPTWATDPDELWNRVELSERRKDSQLARDYRLPIPLGLTDEAAGQLALELAEFICRELTVPVSVGLHRDGDLNAMGEVKPPEKQGFHAHLYFPTRSILVGLPPEGEAGDDTEGDEASRFGFGPKISKLSNRRTSAAVVDRLNERWAALANKYAGQADLTPDYDHRSYERAGLPHVPKPALSRGAVALERKGLFTEQGHRARQIMVASEVYKKAHAVALDMQHERAKADAQGSEVPEVFPSPFDALDEAERLDAEEPGPYPSMSVFGVAPPSPLPEAASRPDSPLVTRFKAVADRPTDPEQVTLRVRVLHLVRAIERALNVLRALLQRLGEHADDVHRRRQAKAEADLELDNHVAHRKVSGRRLERWEVAHPWRVRATQRFGLTPGARSRTWQTLIFDAKRDRKFVHDAKAIVQMHANALDELVAEGAALAEEEHLARGRLSDAVGELDAASSAAIAPLLAAVGDEERSWIQAVLPPEPVSSDAAPDAAQSAVADRLKPRPRRPSPGQ